MYARNHKEKSSTAQVSAKTQRESLLCFFATQKLSTVREIPKQLKSRAEAFSKQQQKDWCHKQYENYVLKTCRMICVLEDLDFQSWVLESAILDQKLEKRHFHKKCSWFWVGIFLDDTTFEDVQMVLQKNHFSNHEWKPQIFENKYPSVFTLTYLL